MSGSGSVAAPKEDAAYIVAACNAYPELVAALVDEFEVTAATAAADLAEMVASLAADKLVVVALA